MFYKVIAFFSIVVLVFGCGTEGSAEPQIGELAPDFALGDIHDKAYKLSKFRGSYVVLEWTNYDCPFVRKHYDSGNMQALQKEYTAKGVIWFSICSSQHGKQGHFHQDVFKTRMKANGASPTAVLLDYEEGRVGRLYGAKTTPHMYIINPEGVLIYKGGIDDRASFNAADIPNSKNYVRAALDEAMSGQPVTDASTQPYGCSVKY